MTKNLLKPTDSTIRSCGNAAHGPRTEAEKTTRATLAGVLTLGALLGMASCGGEPLGSDSEEEIATSQSPIINGKPVTLNAGTVAIYHEYTEPTTCTPGVDDAPFTLPYSLDDKWWPRPCSGKVIRAVPGPGSAKSYYILTARHCITKNGKINGTLPMASDDINITHRRVTMALAPGVLTTIQSNGSMQVTGVPSASYPEAGIHAVGWPAHEFDSSEDMAIIRTGPITTFPVSSGRTPLYMGPQSDLVGMTLKTEGYGRFVPGNCYNHATSGAGVLRSTRGHRVETVTDKLVVHETSLNGESQAHGDSGSAWMLRYGDLLVGVTSTPSTGPGGQFLSKWIQDKLGYLYLVPNTQFRGPRLLFGAQLQDGGVIRSNYDEDSSKTRVRYDWASKKLVLGSFCVTHEWVNPVTSQVVMRTCTTSGSRHSHQQWELTWQVSITGGDLRLTQSSRSRCLVTNASIVGAGPCAGNANEIWRFLTDDEPLANGL